MFLNCRIADLITAIPDAGGLAPRCRDYAWNGDDPVDITIHADHFRPDQYSGATMETVAYMESGYQFYAELLKYQGMMIHASAVEMDGRAYLFSGPCGTGKSTHTRLWQDTFGNAAQVFNDDKPAIRYVDGCWYAYGTPWCGKNGINQNKKVPIAGICFLKQSAENRIRRLGTREAMNFLIWQTLHRFRNPERLELMLSLVDRRIKEVPCFELENRPEADAAKLSYETMRRYAEENGL